MDSCKPFSKAKLQSYRIYSILIPVVLMFFVLECIYVFMSIPSSSIGNAISTIGPYSTAAAMKTVAAGSVAKT